MSWNWTTRPSDCHPDRVVFARGACKSCYNKQRRVAQAELIASGEIERPPPRPKKPATCHPHRSARSGGQCDVCYRRALRESNPELYQKKLTRGAQRYAAMTDEEKRARHFKKYGLTCEAFDSLMAVQGGGCAMCTTPLGGINGYGRSLTHIDHCHATGVVRGLLCNQCNTGLGYLGDTVEALERALAYLKGSV